VCCPPAAAPSPRTAPAATKQEGPQVCGADSTKLAKRIAETPSEGREDPTRRSDEFEGAAIPPPVGRANSNLLLRSTELATLRAQFSMPKVKPGLAASTDLPILIKTDRRDRPSKATTLGAHLKFCSPSRKRLPGHESPLADGRISITPKQAASPKLTSSCAARPSTC